MDFGHIFSLGALRSYFRQQKQMSRDKRESELERVKCPICPMVMDMVKFRKILMPKDIQIPVDIVVSAACKDNGADFKVNLSIKFVDEEIQLLTPFLFKSA